MNLIPYKFNQQYDPYVRTLPKHMLRRIHGLLLEKYGQTDLYNDDITKIFQKQMAAHNHKTESDRLYKQTIASKERERIPPDSSSASRKASRSTPINGDDVITLQMDLAQMKEKYALDVKTLSECCEHYKQQSDELTDQYKAIMSDYTLLYNEYDKLKKNFIKHVDPKKYSFKSMHEKRTDT